MNPLYRVSLIVTLSSLALSACNHNLFKNPEATTAVAVKPNTSRVKPPKSVIQQKKIKKTSVASTNVTTTHSNPSPDKSLKEIADEALASKGQLTREQVNAILKTQSVCRAVDYK